MEKIAIISDVHGNYEALKTVLLDIEKRGIKQIYCLGDVIGKGSHSNECLDLLKNCFMVYGNWEDFFNNKRCSNDLDLKRYELLNAQISEDNKNRLKSLPLCFEIYISGRLVRMFHATPEDTRENVLEIDRIERIYKQFLPTKYTGTEIADVVVYAHTHTQNLMKLYNRTLINVGSVGNAFDIIRNEAKDGKCTNTTNADYLIIAGEINSKKDSSISFEFISLNYDKKLELEKSENNLEKEAFSQELLTGKFRNIKKYESNFNDAYYDIDNL